MISQVNELHLWAVVGAQQQQITTVIAPDEETAKSEARRALGQPGRELAMLAWKSGGCQVVRK